VTIRRLAILSINQQLDYLIDWLSKGGFTITGIYHRNLSPKFIT